MTDGREHIQHGDALQRVDSYILGGTAGWSEISLLLFFFVRGRIFHFIYLDCDWSWETEIRVKSQIKGRSTVLGKAQNMLHNGSALDGACFF